MPITRIVAGGQTGADRGGLAAAIHCHLRHGGFCPRGRIAEDGTIPAKYALTEMTSKNYLVRTEANVVDSDATLIFSCGDLEGGSLKTADFARKHHKPWFHIDLAMQDRQQTVNAVVEWLATKCPAECVLNVAGSRESKSPGIYGVVKARMVDVISAANGKLFYPIGDDASAADDDEEAAVGEAAELKIQIKRAEENHNILYHPKTIEDAVRTVLDALPPESKEEIRGMTDKDKFSLDCHFGLAMWVRNSMIHLNENRIDLYADIQKGCREGKWSVMAEPDSVSGLICMRVWDALHGG